MVCLCCVLECTDGSHRVIYGVFMLCNGVYCYFTSCNKTKHSSRYYPTNVRRVKIVYLAQLLSL
jgi:hypothetical protein